MSSSPLPSSQVGESNDLRRLVSKADQVRTQIDELVSLHDAAVEAAERDARDVLDQARREAAEVIDQADATARATITQAQRAAGDMIRRMRNELEQAIAISHQRKTALDTALSAIDGMSRLLPSTPDGPEPSPSSAAVSPFGSDSG